jgi:hypothetical protein
LARTDDEVDRVYFHNFTIDANYPVQQELTSYTSELPRPLVSDNNELRSVGRRSNAATTLRKEVNQ